VRRVTTNCRMCAKAFCLPHLHLYCDGCNGGRAAALPLPQVQPQQPLDQTVERQQLEIAQMRQQMQALMNMVSLVVLNLLVQCCGSGSVSGRIQNFLSDPDPH
jgi:hypothetical protein